MFVLARISDNVRITPAHFRLRKAEALAQEINKKFANKVVHEVGLCIRLFDIVEVAEPFVLPNDGSTYTRVVFRMVVFRPFLGEILVGRIRSCNATGVTVALRFFDDIFIPAALLQDGTVFVKEEQLWCWEVGEHRLFMDLDEEIRVRVAAETFVETGPVVKSEPQQEGGASTPKTSLRPSPYTITGEINADGLGLLSWWQQQREAEGEE